jgi:hypothetical protein
LIQREQEKRRALSTSSMPIQQQSIRETWCTGGICAWCVYSRERLLSFLCVYTFKETFLMQKLWIRVVDLLSYQKGICQNWVTSPTFIELHLKCFASPRSGLEWYVQYLRRQGTSATKLSSLILAIVAVSLEIYGQHQWNWAKAKAYVEMFSVSKLFTTTW